MKCAVCENAAKFLDFRRGYTKFCSKKCTANSKETADKKKNTIIKKYGVEHFSKTNEYKSKFKETCLLKYGVENPGQISELKKIRSRKKQLTFFNDVCSLIKDTVKPLFVFDEYTHLRDHDLKWQCTKCQEIFLSDLLNKLPECSKCYPKGNYGGPSKIEKEILEEICNFYNGEIITNSRSVIPPKELDIYFPKEKFAIEVNGIYWHSEEKLGDYYHYEKYRLCQEQNISLLMITDFEWQTNRDLIVRMIKHRLKLQNKKIAARLCKIKQISAAAAKEFLTINHLHGFSKSTVHLGLFFNDDLVAVCSVSRKNRFSRKNSNIEIVRLAFSDQLVIGALGKFIKEIKKIYPNTDIETYADLRYGNGSVYTKNNFICSHNTKPGYWYFFNGRLQHRLNWTKKKLIKMGFDPCLTEREIMISLKAIKIFDCGHKHFILKDKHEQ